MLLKGYTNGNITLKKCAVCICLALLSTLIACCSKSTVVNGKSNITYKVSNASSGFTGDFGLKPIRDISCISKNFCLGVGVNDKVYFAKDGQWVAETSLSSAVGSSLNVVSCVSVSFCLIGSNTGYVVEWNGSKFSSQVLVNDNGSSSGISSIKALSCSSKVFCVLSGPDTITHVFNGSRWSKGEVIGSKSSFDGGGYIVGASSATVVGLSCTENNFCEASDNVGEIYSYSDNGWSKPVWIDQGGFPDNVINSISCTSSRFCIAVDNAGGYSVTNKGKFSEFVDVDPSGAIMSVSCSTSLFCVSVDSGGNGLFYVQGEMRSPQLIDSRDALVSVSCASDNYCLAVGASGETYNISYE